jgi:hypothetical protein
MILDAYRGTVDDEGEAYEKALTAVNDWLSRLESPHSVVLEHDGQLVAVSFIVNVAGREYIDPVATVSRRKREGLGKAARGYPFRYSRHYILCRRWRVVVGMAGRIGLPATRAA